MRGLGKADWDGWWLDASEAELSGNWGEMRKLQTAAGPGDVVYTLPAARITLDQLVTELTTLWLVTGNGAAQVARARLGR